MDRMPAIAPTAGPVVRVPPEIVGGILHYLRPRSLRRFGATCRTFQSCATSHRASLVYGQMLMRGALARVVSELVKTHKDCGLMSSVQLEERAALFVKDVVIPKLSCRDKESVPWSYEQLIRLMYPIITAIPTEWALAPYVLEWCAENEWRLWPDVPRSPSPRREILVLLRTNSLEELRKLAREAGWAVGASYLALAKAANDTWTDQTQPMLSAALRTARNNLLCVAKDVPLSVALQAATWRPCESRRVPMAPAWMCIGKAQFVKQPLISQASPHCTAQRAVTYDESMLSRSWLDLLGISKGSSRGLHSMLTKYVCTPDNQQISDMHDKFYRIAARGLFQAAYEQVMDADAAARSVGFVTPGVSPEMLRALVAGRDADVDQHKDPGTDSDIEHETESQGRDLEDSD
jgi:hypothetical protein